MCLYLFRRGYSGGIGGTCPPCKQNKNIKKRGEREEEGEKKGREGGGEGIVLVSYYNLNNEVFESTFDTYY